MLQIFYFGEHKSEVQNNNKYKIKLFRVRYNKMILNKECIISGTHIRFEKFPFI